VSEEGETPATAAPPPQRHPCHSGTSPPPQRHPNRKEPIHTPHTPQAPPGGLNGPGVNRQPRGHGVVLSLEVWLAEVQASGQDAIPKADQVFGYADAVQLPREFVALCWREFKRRQLKAGKRHRDWRERFRQCVEGNWYGLWRLEAGQAARLASNGEQALRFFEALDHAAAAGEGGEP
jgi:hypothetical protein